MKPIVFLHLPKTAGQTIHHAIGAICGEDRISPLRLQSQVTSLGSFPAGYDFHSGHLHWDGLEAMVPPPFAFSVIRDPKERFASFYFYMRHKIREQVDMSGPITNHAIHAALTEPAEMFFFNPDEDLEQRIRLAWANRTMTYFALRRLERRREDARHDLTALLEAAMLNVDQLSAVYDFEDLSPLEDDVETLWGARPEIVACNTNKGPVAQGESRWARLLDELGSDRLSRGLEKFVFEDNVFVDALVARNLGEGGRLKGLAGLR